MIDIRNINKKYYIGTENELHVLKDMSMFIAEGEFVAIIGQSGSGKSTLMNIIGALDKPTSGEYLLNNIPVQEMSDEGLSQVRNRHIGFVFQTYNLIGRSSAINNVELPMVYAHEKPGEREERAKELLTLVGMGERMYHQPNELSGGQKQRVAIARALANDPSIILADEPTGALDLKTGNMVMDLFMKIHEEEKKTIVLITHNQELADLCPRIITIRDGEIVDDVKHRAA